MRSRTGKDDMLKRERDRLTVKLTRFLTTLGAQTDQERDLSSGPQTMYVETLAGRLQIVCYGDWLACRFADVDRAKALLPHGPGERLNSHSGKWNFHFPRITAEEALAAFRAELELLLPVKRTDGATMQETPVCPAEERHADCHDRQHPKAG